MIHRIREKFRTGNFSELARGSFQSFLLRIVGILVSYVFTIVVTRLLGADVYGAFMLAQTLMMVSVMFARMGIDTVMLRWVSALRAKGKDSLIPLVFKRGFGSVLLFALLLSFLFWFLAPILAEHLFEDPDAHRYLKWMSLGIVPMSLVFLSSEALRGLKRVRETMILRNILPFGFAALLVLLFRPTGTAMDPVRALLIGIGVSALTGLFLWTRRIGWKGNEEEKGEYGVKAMIRTAHPLFLTSSMVFLMSWLDLVMLGYFVDDAEVGVYSVAMRVANLCNVALFAVNMIAAPQFSEKYSKGDMEGLDRTVRRATQMVFTVVFPLVLVLFAFSTPILSLFGEEFTVGDTTLWLLVLGKFVNAASGSVMYLLQMTDRERVGRNILLVAALVNIVLNLLWIPLWGIEGAAWASMISIAGWNIYAGIYIWRNYRILTFFWPFRR